MSNIIKHRGIAVLEATGALLILVSLVIAGFGLVEYMRVSRSLSSLLEKNVYETAFKPYKISSALESQDASAIQLNRSGLDRYVEDLSDKLADELHKNLSGIGDKVSGFVIESTYAELKINPVNGRFEGLASAPSSNSKYSGNTSLKQAIDRELNLDQKFSDFANKDIQSGGETSDRRAYYAIPNASYSVAEGTGNFLPATVLVGVRAGVSLENTLIGSMLEIIGSEAFLSEYKIVTLRGEISDEI